MNFIDSNIIVKAYTDAPEKERCRKMLSEPFLTDTLCLIEAAHSIGVIKKNREYASTCIKALYKSGAIIIPIDKNLLFHSFKRFAHSRLLLFDAIHFTAAFLNNCSSMVTYDADFDGLDLKRIIP